MQGKRLKDLEDYTVKWIKENGKLNWQMRKKRRTKKLNKKGGSCLGCESSLKEYLLYDNNGEKVHQTPIALGKSEVERWRNLGFTVEEV